MGKYRVPLFYLFTSLFWGSIYAYMSFLTPFAQSVGASAGLAGLIVGSYGFVQMVLRIPVGLWSDRLRRRKPFVCAGAIASTLAAAGMFLWPTPGGLLMFRAFAGIAAAAWVPITVLFSSYFPPQDAPAAMGKLNAFNTLGVMSASLLGAQTAQRAGHGSAFLLGAFLGLSALGIAVFLVENRPTQMPGQGAKALVGVALTPSLLAVAGLALAHQIVNMGTSGSFTQSWAKELGASTAMLGWLTICSGAPNMLMALLGGAYLVRRCRPSQLVLCGMAAICAAIALIPHCKSMPGLLAAQTLQGLGSGLTMPMLMSLAIVRIPQQKRGVAMGVFQSIYALGMFIGPVLSGRLAEAMPLRSTFFVMTALAGAMLALGGAYFLWERAMRRREEPQPAL